MNRTENGFDEGLIVTSLDWEITQGRGNSIWLMTVLALLLTSRAFAQRSEAIDPPQETLFHQDLSWSADGHWIAFSEYTPGGDSQSGIWSINVIGSDGSGRRKIFDEGKSVSWSPDGRRLAFESERDGSANIYVIDLNGENLKRLTDGAARFAQPAWSPTGERIALSSDRDGNQEIYTMTTEGLDMVRLTKDGARDFSPFWSRDGHRVVFYRDRGDGMDQVFELAVADRRETQITNDDGNNIYPSFLPDGQIAYHSRRKNSQDRLLCVNAEGKLTREIALPTKSFFARWSPDGRRIAMIGGAWPKSAIYLMNDDGTGVRKLVN